MINNGKLFAGLDRIDWAGMSHAYGSAVEVPELLRGLVAEDPARREYALDALYGAVHHQGDVYDSTVAAIPFLLDAVGRPDLPGRGGIVELLASIGGAFDDEADDAEDDDFEDDALGDDDDEDDDDADGDHYRRARALLAAAYPIFLGLLTDPDPEVRAQAPTALLVGPVAAGAVAALRERLTVERETPVRAAVVRALGTLGRRAASARHSDVDGIVADLSGVVAGTEPPELRLAALAELARWAPAALPPDVVTTVLNILDEIYTEDVPLPQPAGFSTDTLVGALRELREQEQSGRRAPQAAELVREVSWALGDQVPERTALLTALLRTGDWERRYDALRPATALIEGWRGDYRELVFLFGEQLSDPQPRLAAAAAERLQQFAQLAAPAADALAHALDVAPREGPGSRNEGLPPWVIRWPRDLSAAGPLLQALAALADPRVLPALRWALEQKDPPADIGRLIGHFGVAAADLVPLIRQRLRDLPPMKGHDRRRVSLVVGLRRTGAPAASYLPELLALLPESAALRTLAELGPAAADAAPALRPLLQHERSSTAVAAALALWRIQGDPDPVLQVLAHHLDGDEYAARGAAEGLGHLGPAASGYAIRLRSLLTADDPYGWLPLNAAISLWRITGEVEAVLPVLRSAWQINPMTRVRVVDCLAEMGSAAAGAETLLRAEVGRVRRHNARDGVWSSSVAADEVLLRACHRALAAIGAG